MDKLKIVSYKYFFVLFLVFALIAFIRISIAYQSPLPDFAAYGQLRQVHSIQENGIPLFADDLSFGGRTRIFSPVYQYVLAFFGLFLPELWLVKVIPNLFFAAIVFPSFLITRHITKRPWLSVITAGMVALVPASFLVSINDASPLGLSMTLLCFASYLFMQCKNSAKNLELLLLVIGFMVVLHPISVVFLLGLAFYILFLQLHQLKTSGKDIEIVLFTLFFTVWFSMVIYKKAFVAHGAHVIWQNVPSAELSVIFSRLTLLDSIGGIGVITLLFGAYAVYDTIMHAKRKPLFLLAGMLLSIIVLMWFRLVAVTVGVAFLGVFLALASGRSLDLLLSYFEKTKVARFAWVSIGFVVVVFVLLSVPAILFESLLSTPSDASIKVLSETTLPVNAVILGAPIEGDLFAFMTNRGSVIDANYLLIPRVQERYEDVKKMYKSFFKIDALSLMQKYGATHVFVSDQTALFSGVDVPSFLSDDCFFLVNSATDSDGVYAALYERKCSLRGSVNE